ncbi:MFS transporter [Alkalicoccus luteus]|uniref:MFS transporter n=1 Tax=Alkalicoccus luteus TaxID=1237094 RepID=UPI0040331990
MSVQAKLLTVTSLSAVGSWTSFIAVNLYVLMETSSAFAVALLYIVRPIAGMAASLPAGALADRMPSRSLLAKLDMFQVVALILLFAGIMQGAELYVIYLLVFLSSAIQAAYDPVGASAVVRYVPVSGLQRYHAIRAVFDSGAFVIGPAAAGVFAAAGWTEGAILAHCLLMAVSFLLTCLLPAGNVPGAAERTQSSAKARALRFTVVISLFYTLFIVMQTVTDSLEAAFSIAVIGLSEAEYGVLVGSAGIGLLAGSVCNKIWGIRLTPLQQFLSGALGVSAGYLLYAVPADPASSLAGFIVIGFFTAPAGSGYHAFYQARIDAAWTGRFRAKWKAVESISALTLTAAAGLSADLWSMHAAVLLPVALMVLFMMAACAFTYLCKDTDQDSRPLSKQSSA